MEITLPQLLTILGMAVATYSTRVLSYLFLRGRDFSPDVKKLFEMIGHRPPRARSHGTHPRRSALRTGFLPR